MIMYYLEAPVDANVNDIVAFLEKENRVISPYQIRSDKPDGKDITVNFHCEKHENTISIYTKVYTTPAGKLAPRKYLDDPNGQGNEVIRFEVSRLTDTRSVVKGLYQKENSHINLMFWRRWARLGTVFEAGFASEASIVLEELEQNEEQWYWHESSATIFGNKVLHYGPSPKTDKENNVAKLPADSVRNDRYVGRGNAVRIGGIMAQDKNLFRQRLQTAISLYADTNHRRYQDVVNEINYQLGYPEGTVQEWLITSFIPNSAEVEYLAKKLTSGTTLDHGWVKELYDVAGYEPPKYLITPKPVPPISAAGENAELNQARALKFEQEMKDYEASLAHIFLSYARPDQAIVEQLYDFLQENDLNPWMDVKDLVPGEDWMRAITRAISQSDFFIVVLSENSYRRRGVMQRELSLAMDKMYELLPEDVFIIPLRLDNCAIPDRLANLHIMEWDEGNGRERLLGAIQVGLERRMG